MSFKGIIKKIISFFYEIFEFIFSSVFKIVSLIFSLVFLSLILFFMISPESFYNLADSDIDFSNLNDFFNSSEDHIRVEKDSIRKNLKYNESNIKQIFYDEINLIRAENNKEDMMISSRLEEQSEKCLQIVSDDTCEILPQQKGIIISIPWDSNVEDCGFAQTAKQNVKCLIDELREDYSSDSRIFEELLEMGTIGIAVKFDNETTTYPPTDFVVYSITIE